MPSPTENITDKELTAERFAICLLLVCSLQIMENLLPKIPIFPWLRLGLAYWIILPFLLRFGIFSTLMLFILRNLITLIYGGQLFSSFLISSSAGVLSLLITGSAGLFLYNRNILGVLGLSVALAGSFNLIQLIVVDLMLIQHSDFYFQLGPILFWSLLSGSFVALLVHKSRDALQFLFEGDIALDNETVRNGPKEVKAIILPKLGILLSLLLLILIVPQIEIQLLILVFLGVVTRLKSMKLVFYAWPFFFYIAWLHLFRTDGIYVLLDWITKEGLDAFIYYSVRTVNVIMCGQWIAVYVPMILGKTRKSLYLEGMGYTVPVLPAIFGISIAQGKKLFAQLKKRQFNGLLDPLIQGLLEEFRAIEKRG